MPTQTTPTHDAPPPAAPAPPARRRARGARWGALAAVIAITGVGASFLGARAVDHSETERSRLAFHLTSAEIASTLQLAIQREEDLVLTASAFVAWNRDPSASAFDSWAASVHALARYPELENIGLVRLVPATQLPAFASAMTRRPLEPFGVGRGRTPYAELLPAGTRPFYCLASAGIARNAATYLPAGLDYCAATPSLMAARDQGQSSYAPFPRGRTLALGIQTPIYRAGATPASVAARRRDFVGWLGELILPQVVVARALQGHPATAVTFTYAARDQHAVFGAGHAPAHAQRATINLHNGWTVESVGAPLQQGLVADHAALAVLLGGVLVSILLGVIVFVLGTGRTRAMSLVHEKTRELSHQALHDGLTGLPNRTLVLDRAEQMLARVARHPELGVGALFVDVDGFKHVNDKLGHAAGDRLLQIVAERLQDAVRSADTVGRLGGDEFVVLVETAPEGPTPDVLADRLIEALRAPAQLDDGRLMSAVTASIGLAVGRYARADDLLRDADLALYAAKAAGRNRYVLFEPGLGEHARSARELEADLAGALGDGQLFLLYQPIFDLARQRLIGAEALLRWRHPERGVVAPADFIPLAEDSGLIVPIGRWVLEEACRQAAGWWRDGHRLGVSVNVSALQLGRAAFRDEVTAALAAVELDAELLTLEITETTLMRDVRGAGERLREIKALGVNVAIDDFGTGYASLASLQRMPVDVLKLDRSFVAALGDEAGSRELLEAVLGVGHALSLRVVAEGIEVESQMVALEEMGCEMAQGFLMGRPSPAEAITAIVAEPRTTASGG